MVRIRIRKTGLNGKVIKVSNFKKRPSGKKLFDFEIRATKNFKKGHFITEQLIGGEFVMISSLKKPIPFRGRRELNIRSAIRKVEGRIVGRLAKRKVVKRKRKRKR